MGQRGVPKRVFVTCPTVRTVGRNTLESRPNHRQRATHLRVLVPAPDHRNGCMHPHGVARMNNDAAVIAATQTLLDQAADRAWNRMIDAQGTPLHSMCRDIAFAAKDRADTYRHTHRTPINTAIEALNTAAWQAHDIDPSNPQAGTSEHGWASSKTLPTTSPLI